VRAADGEYLVALGTGRAGPAVLISSLADRSEEK
jgi:hypothetical protein